MILSYFTVASRPYAVAHVVILDPDTPSKSSFSQVTIFEKIHVEDARNHARHRRRETRANTKIYVSRFFFEITSTVGNVPHMSLFVDANYAAEHYILTTRMIWAGDQPLQ